MPCAQVPRLDLSNAVPFKIDGVYCRLISLTFALVTIVDAEDYEWLAESLWSPHRCASGFYAKRVIVLGSGRTQSVYMHREILRLAHGDVRRADHRSRNTLDNRRANLRLATRSQNAMNRCANHVGLSRLKGVSFDRNRGKWVAQIKVAGKNINLGRFDLPDTAADAYRKASIQHFGEFACFDPSPQPTTLRRTNVQ